MPTIPSSALPTAEQLAAVHQQLEAILRPRRPAGPALLVSLADGEPVRLTSAALATLLVACDRAPGVA